MRSVRLARRPMAGLPLAVALTAALGMASVGLGADGKPAKKDSAAAARPRQATVTAKMSPAEARPGETVTLSVTAELDPGWHIYGYQKTQPDDGPRVTQFDLFDRAGLTAKGDWTASPEPTRKKDPAFPDLDHVEYHLDTVTWSLPMTVPADAQPGKRTIRLQVGYQVCSEATCSFPGQWTLPDVALTVAGAPAEVAKADPAVKKTSSDAPVDAAPKQPARKDSRAPAPKGVSLSTRVEPAQARPGATVSLQVTARLTPKWHIYKYAKAESEVGPKLTLLEVFDPAGLSPGGEFTPSKPPIRHEEKAFADQVPYVEYYDDEVTWSLPMTVPADAKEGPRAIKVQASYMICDDRNCSTPGRWTLPDAALTVLAADPGVAATTPAASPTPAAPSSPAEPTATSVKPAAPEVTSGSTPASDAYQSDIQRQKAAGLIPFLATCAAGGLLALVMPCVWPMIPITVNFFVKQGQKKEGSTTGLAIVYCLAIIGVFTLVGVLFSAFFGAASLSKLANNRWLNFTVAGLFLAFGLSLLGLFEIRLPNVLLNASAQGEGKGGLVGVMFMALTLTITSFTCTFPVVGGLLVMAAGGDYLYPVIGLATFATVLALPFFVLALSPGLLSKMPRSGDWMNSVKVIGGLIEIGAAFKFVNTAEVASVVPEDAVFNAYTVLSIWVVLALVCGIYLLGLFRTDHDQEAAKVGPGRIVLGSTFLTLALFLAPALFGRTPQGRVWSLVVGLLPADSGNLEVRGSAGGGGGAGESGTDAKSTDPKVALREQKSFHGVAWGFSYEAAVEEAKSTGKPILIDFTGVNCANCRLMEKDVFPKKEAAEVMRKFVAVQLYTDFVPIPSITKDQRESIGEENLAREQKYASEVTNPLYVVVNPDGALIAAKGGYMPLAEFTGFLNDALVKRAGGGKVAGR